MTGLKLFSLEGKKGFITGGSQGIGKCIATAFAHFGADIAIVNRNVDLGNKIAEEIATATGRTIKAYACDVSSPESVEQMMEQYLKDFGTIDFAINNAGIFTNEDALSITPEAFESVLNVNLKGAFYTARVAAKAMKKQGGGGSIITTASMSGSIVNIPQTIANYCASKAGIIHLSKSLAVEWAKYNIRVNTVSPGYIKTELIASLSDMLPIWESKLPEGSKIGNPEDLIGAYVYLASDASKYATGSDLIVDGGYSIL